MRKYRIAILTAILGGFLTLTPPCRAQIINGGGGGTFNGGTINNGLTNNGGTSQTGSLVVNGIGQPSAPTVTPNTTGTTTATYYCVALDLNGLTNLTGGVGNTLPSSGTTITNGAATPNTTITCAGMTGALGFIVLKNSTSNSFLGSCLNLTSGNSCSVPDTGQALTSYTASSQDNTQSEQVGPLILNDPSGRSVAGVSAYFTGYVTAITLYNTMKQWTTRTQSELPTCNSGYGDMTVCASDATACTNGTTYTGGGGIACHLHCNGTNWIEDGFGC